MESVAGRDGRIITDSLTENPKVADWGYAFDFVARAQNLESHIDIVERTPPEEPGKPVQFIPIRFIYTNKFTKDDKLLLAFDALVLSEVLGREVGVGRIIHGNDQVTLKVKTSALASEVRKLISKITTLISEDSPPDLILNRHCAECEFKARCKQKAIEADDLSLLSAMSEKERSRHRSKGIFTVNQLSYTFRPRRTPKRAKNPARPHYLALQALSIRENTVHIHGNPQLPESKSRVYLDIEGLPDTEFYYAQEFGSLLRVAIQTVDRYGLKSRHLRKHKPTVLRFLDSVASKDFTSDLAVSYKRRFQKSGAKMFTFLDHDGVPWNNNNAEHAIKGFAKFRAHADGRFTERSLREYLVLASVFQTCEFNNVNVLKFLLSKETTLAGLFKMARRKDHATLHKPENAVPLPTPML